MIRVRTTVLELGLYRDDYQASVNALVQEGFPAEIDDPEEYRDLGTVEAAIGIYLLGLANDAARDAAVDAIKRAAAATISKAKRGRRTQKVRRLPIYRAQNSNDVLGWVELPDDSSEDDAMQ